MYTCTVHESASVCQKQTLAEQKIQMFWHSGPKNCIVECRSPLNDIQEISVQIELLGHMQHAIQDKTQMKSFS